MAISLQTGLKQTQKLAMTQSLKQAIELLHLSNIELYERISNELLDNAVIEEEPASALAPNAGESDLITAIISNLSGDESTHVRDEERYVCFDDASDTGFSGGKDDDKKRQYLENLTALEESLSEHLLWQARLTARDANELEIYQTIITSLSENGFLDHDPGELFSGSGFARGQIDSALAVIQLFDPVGCAVHNVRESLRVQCCYFYPTDTVLQKIVTDYFELLEKLDYDKIARSINIPPAKVLEKSRIIHSLDPFPGRQYSRWKTRYIIPDMDVKLIDGAIILVLNDDWIPGLRVNSYYISLLKKKNIEKKLRNYIQDKMQSARYLIRNIDNRRNTILKVASAIMEHQREFLERGPGHLKPLTHGEVAKEVKLHESTISRVASNKYVQTSWGVFDLKYFFASRLRSAGYSDDTSSNTVMNLIRDIIERENAAAPHSDEDIARILGKAGLQVARRTVAKYRGIMRISPSNVRKKINKIKTEECT
ncbi:MAG: RNA polymerase sigma-54 factor [Spirochaetes bacterium RBG_13_51_14]|nr:MAG: RNA polymerase sigma-54 factor [Spirochaetes bacterium RBG_13_51_14]